MKKHNVFLVAILSFPITVHSAEFDIGYDNKYISEGRNNLYNGGIFWARAGSELNEHFVISAAYGMATDTPVDYDELNIGIEYSHSLGEFDYYVGYTRLEFFEYDENDNEIGMGFAWNGNQLFTPFADYVYSTKAEGGFVTLGVEKKIALTDVLSFSPYILIAFDFGYASEVYNGHNHTSIGGILDFQLSDTINMRAILEHSMGGEDVKINGSQNIQTWSGLHFSTAF